MIIVNHRNNHIYLGLVSGLLFVTVVVVKQTKKKKRSRTSTMSSSASTKDDRELPAKKKTRLVVANTESLLPTPFQQVFSETTEYWYDNNQPREGFCVSIGTLHKPSRRIFRLCRRGIKKTDTKNNKTPPQPPPITVRQLKDSIRDRICGPDVKFDLIYNCVALKNDEYHLSDYNIYGNMEKIDMACRLHRNGLGVKSVEQRRIQRLIKPFLIILSSSQKAAADDDDNNNNAMMISPALYPFALERLNIQSGNDPNVLFHAIKESLFMF